MRAFLALPNRDKREHDYTGAFRPEADRFHHVHDDVVEATIALELHPADRRAQLLQALRAGQQEPFQLVALLCHGWQQGLQLGVSVAQAPELAAAIASVTTRGAAVVLYACSTAEGGECDAAAGTACGTGNFAAALYGALSCCVLQDGSLGNSLHLDAHDRSGHCTSNPYVRRFAQDGEDWLVAPGSPLWHGWERELGSRHDNTLRLRYPALTREEITLYLRTHYSL